MDNKTLFFILGPVLVVAALTVAGLGLRNESFPSRAQLVGIIAVFVVLVGGTSAFAVLNAQEEPLGDENREAAQAALGQGQEHAVQESDNPGDESGSPSTAEPEAAAPSGGGETLKVNSPQDGSLKFDPATLQAKAGMVTIDYDNPSPVPHDIAIEGPGGEVLDQTTPAAMQTFTVSADLKPGSYVYYCTVPGHREAGMEGKLTVK